MSIMYCHTCDKYIDTDEDVDHFMEDTEVCAENYEGDTSNN